MAEVEEEVERLARGGWDELPDDTKEKILAHLPLEYLCRSKAVSKEWNALFSCPKFITKKWAEGRPNKKPWLILFGDDHGSVVRRRFCFFTWTWKNCPRDFASFVLPENEYVHCAGSAEGLFLVYSDGYWMGPRFVEGTNTVCNPLTRKFLLLPSMSSINEVIGRVTVGWKVDTDQETYKVVVVGRTQDDRGLKVEIYDSYEKSWGVVRYLPENLTQRGRKFDIVFRDGFFYCILFNPHDGLGVLCFSIVEGTSTFTPLPSIDGKSFIMVDGRWPRIMVRLLICGSRILHAVIPSSSSRIVNPAIMEIREVTLWEFQNDPDSDSSSSTSSWKEITRMPPSIDEVLRVHLGFMHCVGVEDGVCFANPHCKDIAVYHVREDTWSWLPSTDGEYWNPSLMAFKPRLDIRV